MALHFRSFSSGSGGNCYLIKSEKTALLVDVGISGRRIFDNLEKAETRADDLAAVLITHEHMDHIKSLRTMTRKIPRVLAYANRGTWNHLREMVKEEQRAVFETGAAFAVGDILVKPFPICHDASEPVGFSFRAGGGQISLLTDTGCLNSAIFEEIKEADLLILEANHDVEMLKFGRYPWFLKRRILGESGHLSNADTAAVICRLLAETKKRRHILLAHLSKENNFPEMAYQTIKNALEESNYFIDENLCLQTIARDEMSALYTVC